MSAADKKKLDGIEAGATANTGTITGITIGTQKGTSLVQGTTGVIPIADTETYGLVRTTYDEEREPTSYKVAPIYNGYVYYYDTTYPNASDYSTGLMSSTMYKKLNGLHNISMSYSNGTLTITYN
jgi:hypothetical protein